MSHIMNSVQHQKNKQHASSLDRIEEEEKNTDCGKKKHKIFCNNHDETKKSSVELWSGVVKRFACVIIVMSCHVMMMMIYD